MQGWKRTWEGTKQECMNGCAQARAEEDGRSPSPTRSPAPAYYKPRIASPVVVKEQHHGSCNLVV
eukprot:1160997-Pelagomonas_calceolata.AAC.23